MPNSITLKQYYPKITKSNLLYERAKKLIPAGTQTLAKGTTQFVEGVAPKYLAKGKGSHVWDVDGNEYIDLVMGVGPISLGYTFEEVDNAIISQLKDGITFSLMHQLEVEVAEMINEIVQNAESVRFSKTGADVTSAAIRIARAFTGRNKVLCCGYHGWHDWYISTTDRNKGIPAITNDLVYTFNYNDIQSVIDSIDRDVACIILEPIVFEEPKNNFLHELRELCTKHGILLIFDEMWTGFRLSLGGAQEYFGVKADLACFSKAVANGMPLSVLTGRKDIMSLLDNDVFFFTTFGGEALSLAAAKATLDFMRQNKVQSKIAERGKKLKVGFNKIVQELNINFISCSGYDCRTIINFNNSFGNPLEMKTLMQQELIRCGVLWNGFHNLSYSHSNESIDYILQAYREILPILKTGVDEKNIFKYLKGETVKPVFRKTENFNTKPAKKIDRIFNDLVENEK